MKKSLIILAIMFLAAPAVAQTVTMHNLSQVTVAWDAVAPPESTAGMVKYQVYVKSDPASIAGPKIGGEIEATQALISFLPFVTYYAGVQTVFYPEGSEAPGSVPVVSAISWSNIATDCSPEGTFGFYYQPALGKPRNMLILR